MKKHLIAGVLVWLPIAITFWLLSAIFTSINSIFHSLLLWVQNLTGIHLPEVLLTVSSKPGVGLLVVLLVIFITGLFAANIFGRWWISLLDKILNKIPLVKSIYSTVKQIAGTLLSDNGQSFKEAVLIEYPKNDIWTVAFVTGSPNSSILDKSQEKDEYISVFIPTTPNPTSGFLLITQRSKVKTLDITVEQALKYVVSMGVLQIEKSESVEPNR